MVVARMPTTFVSMNRGRSDRQRHWSVDSYQEHRNDHWHVGDDGNNGLTNYANGGQYSQGVGNDELSVEGRTYVDGATHIEATGCWLTPVNGGTSSEEKTENRED